MINRSVVAGFGGQGVMMIGKMLCYASLDHGKHALFLPSYGTEQRGGTANCTVILSDEEIGSPMTAHIDTLIAMNEPSLKKFQGMVKPGGTVYINSSLVKPEDVREDDLLELGRRVTHTHSERSRGHKLRARVADHMHA